MSTEKITSPPDPVQRVVIDRVLNGWRVGVADRQSQFMSGVAHQDYVFNDPDELARNVRQLIAPGEGRVETDYTPGFVALLAEFRALKFPPVPVSLFGPDGNPLDGFRPGHLWTNVGCNQTRCIISVSPERVTYWLHNSSPHGGSLESYAPADAGWVKFVGKDATRTCADFQPAAHPGEPPQGFRVGDVWTSVEGTTRRITSVSSETVEYISDGYCLRLFRLLAAVTGERWDNRVGPGAKLVRK